MHLVLLWVMQLTVTDERTNESPAMAYSRHFGLLLVLGPYCFTPAQQCTLCIDGSDPPLLDAPVFDFESPATCADFVVAALEISDIGTIDNFLACHQLQDVGLSNCGCITPSE
jgi:hypothetical protein